MINKHLNINNLEPQHQLQHKILFDLAQGVIDKTFTTMPTTTNLPVGYIGKYISGTTYRLVINIDNSIYYVALTKV